MNPAELGGHVAETTQSRILQTILSNPGITKSEMLPMVSVAWSTLSYHVTRLYEAGKIELHGHGRLVTLFPSGYTQKHMLWLSTLRSEEGTTVVGYFQRHRQGTIASVARRQGISRRVARRQLMQLVEAGVLDLWRGGHPRFILAEERKVRATEPPTTEGGERAALATLQRTGPSPVKAATA